MLLMYPLLSTGCGQRSVWGFPTEELAARLSRGGYGALSSLDFTSLDPSEAFDLGPGAPYYLSFVFGKLNKADISLKMLQLAWSRSPSPWKEEAGFLLADRYIADKDYSNAVKAARQLASMLDGTSRSMSARRLLVEALYWDREDEETLTEAARISPGDVELSLFRAVSSLRLGRDNARGLFVDLFLMEKTSPVHARAYLFLSADSKNMGIFSDPEKDLLAAKFAFQQGDWAKGIPLMEGVVSRLEPACLAGSPLISELGAAYIYGGLASRGASFLEKLAGGLDGGSRLDALEAAGKCYRRIPDYGRAMACFRAVADGSGDPGRQDRARWYILDALLKTAPSDLITRIALDSTRWNDPAYFSDLLEDEISSLVADHKWQTLMGLQAALGGKSSGLVKAQLAFVIARALQEGLVSPVPGGSGEGPHAIAAAMLRIALESDPDGYYGTMAASLLGELPPCVLFSSEQQGSAKAAGMDPFIQGFLSFGLTREAFTRIWGSREGFTDDEIAAYAREFAAAEDHREAMNLMDYLSGRGKLSGEEMRVLFPRAFSSIIESLGTGSPFPAFFLYGMIREESYFDPDITSGAGAVGLAQLMPATATDVAKSLKLASPDLTDPQTSITLGVHYLDGLLSKSGSLPKALLSYNAGLTRSRSWDRLNGGLAPDLFVEAVPFDESRQYVRKILVSTVIYAYLYGGQDPRETVKLFFPEVLK
jgi:hypothetical protein